MKHVNHKGEYKVRIIIDRFEGKFAVVELKNKSRINMPKELVPKGAKEGDILEIRIDKEETQRRRKRIENLLKDLCQ